MNIIIMESKMQFKSPYIGQPSRAVEEHYFGRRVLASVGGEMNQYHFKANEIPFAAEYDDIVHAIRDRITPEATPLEDEVPVEPAVPEEPTEPIEPTEPTENN